MKFRHQSFGRRLRTMLAVDFRRMFTMPLLYILVGCCLVMPVLILVMTTMMDGSVSVNPQTGEETVIEGFDSTWQIIGSASSESAGMDMSTAGGEGMGMDMSMTSMCNINMLYFIIAVLVCLFVGDDFRSGYAKNLFTVRAKKGDYVASKSLVCFVGGALMIIAFFLGSLIGGAVSGLSFDLGAVSMGSVIMCLIAKVFLVAVFVPIYLMWSVVGKQKVWMSMVGSFCVSMLFFMMIPMLTPLDSTIVNVALCLAGGVLFSVGFGAASRAVLNRTSLV